MYYRNRGPKHLSLSLIGLLSAFILVFSPMLITPVAVNAASLGDINGDGDINILDLTLLKLILLGVNPSSGNDDVDDNGILNLLDPDALVDLIIGESLPHSGGGGGSGGGGNGGPTPTPAPAPTVTSISPTFGPTAGGTAVTITGTGFVSGATTTIGGASATGVAFVNATALTATTPAGTAGAKDVIVTNPDAQSGTLPGGFTYNSSCTPPNAITNLAIMSETLGGIEWNSIRLTWTSPNNSAVDSYTVKYNTSSAITNTNWASSTTATVTFASIKGIDTTQNCTVTGLTENQLYYFAVKSSKTGCGDSAISTTSPSATARQPRHDVGDWWIYKEYYTGSLNDMFGNAVAATNKAYFITNVIQTGVNTTVYADANDATGTSSGPCAVVNKWVDERKIGDGGWGRTRVVWVPTALAAKNVMHDLMIYITDDDWTQPIRINCLPEAFETPLAMGDDCMPTIQSYWNGTHTAKVAWSGAQSNGYPYSNTKTFGWYEFIHADTDITSGTSHRHFYKDYTWVTGAWNASYDVSTASSDPDARGIGTYGVWPLTINDTWVGSDGTAPPNDADPILMWYSPAVHNFVRNLDKIRVAGREDQAIVAYEVRDIQKSTPTVTWSSSYVNVSMTVTNILDVTSNFSLLCTLAAMNATEPYGHTYLNGQLRYPDLSSISGTIPWGDPANGIGNAVRYTGNISPGNSSTVSWNISGSFTAGQTYDVWCQGQTVRHAY